MRKFLFPLFLFFFIVLTVPAMAYLPVEVNQTYSGSFLGTYSIAVSNLTGTLYIYRVGTPSGSYPHIQIERFNATFQERVYCDIGQSGGTYIRGLNPINSTHLLIPLYDGTSYVMDVSNIATNTSCPATGGGDSGVSLSSYFVSGGFYNSSGINPISGWVYYGDTVNVRNSVDFSDLIMNSPYAINEYEKISLPNSSDNYTSYAMRSWNLFSDGSIYKFLNGNLYANYSDIYTAFGVSARWWDMVNFSTYNLIYFVGSDGRLYVGNWSLVEQYGNGTILTPVSPQDGEYLYTIPDLTVQLSTDVNGTLFWYVNGAVIGSVVITTNGTMTDQPFSVNQGTATDGTTYTWYALFTDQYANGWQTLPRTWTYSMDSSLTTLLTNPTDGLALMIGGAFGVSDLESARLIAGTLLSFIGALASVIIISVIAKGHLHASELTMIFGLSIVVLIVLFTFADWLPAWLSALIIVIGAFAFVKMAGVGFAGGG